MMAKTPLRPTSAQDDSPESTGGASAPTEEPAKLKTGQRPKALDDRGQWKLPKEERDVQAT